MAILKNAIESLDPVKDKKTQLTLCLSLLSEMCEQKVREFKMGVEEELRTAGNGENKTFPVTEILARHTEYRAYVSHDAGKIATEVSAAIKKFVSGGTTDIIDGVASLVTTAITAIIGAGTGTQQEVTSYYIIVQDYGMARYDICCWSRQIEAQGITSQIEHALAFVAFKSSVDISKISYNTFLLGYGNQLAAMNFPKDKQLEYLEYAKKVYHELRGDQKVSQPAGRWGGDQSFGNGATEVSQFHCPGQFKGTLWQ